MKVLGLDIGGTRVKAGIVDENGEILSQTAVDTPIDPEGFKRILSGMVWELAPKDDSLAGVGIGCKGIINYETTKIEVMPGLLRPLEGSLLRDLVPLDVPIRADNDAKVALAGELMWGAAKGRKNVLLFTLGTGVGGAILAEGKFVRGVGGVAGHLGHVTVDPNGPTCICGNHGCLEALFSADAIESEAFRIVHFRRRLLAHRPLPQQSGDHLLPRRLRSRHGGRPSRHHHPRPRHPRPRGRHRRPPPRL